LKFFDEAPVSDGIQPHAVEAHFLKKEVRIHSSPRNASQVGHHNGAEHAQFGVADEPQMLVPVVHECAAGAICVHRAIC
jgi:hypothetical protein